MKKYFDDCTTEAQVKKTYKKLALEHNPRTMEELADKSKSDIMQEINEQKITALRRIAVSEGEAPSYYEELEAKVKQGDFNSIVSAAQEIEKKLSGGGMDSTDFSSVFKAVSEMFYTPKKEKAIEPKSPGALPGPKQAP